MELEQADTIPTEETKIKDHNGLCMVPANYFFIETLILDSSISPEEHDDFFELQIESIAPLPTDQLYWGYFLIPNSNKAVLYAASKSRLQKDGFNSLENYIWVVPEFIPYLSAGILNIEMLSEPAQLSNHIQSLGYNIDLNDDQSIIIGGDSDLESSELNPIDETILWPADIRMQAFKKLTERNRKRNTLLNKTFLGSIYFFILIIISETTLIGANFWLKTYDSKIEKQETTVRIIEDQHSLINKLEQISQHELRPIALLEKANEIRLSISSNIIYDTVDISGENKATIKGTVGSVNELNRYITQLNQSKYFEISEDPKYITRGGKTTFTLQISYKH